MAAKYFVAIRPQVNDNHAVHKEGCPFLPDDKKRIYLGVFTSGKVALRESHRHFNKTNGCIFCSKEHNVVEEKPIQYEWADKNVINSDMKAPLPYHQSHVYCVN
jgi:hypothetical protein